MTKRVAVLLCVCLLACMTILVLSCEYENLVCGFPDYNDCPNGYYCRFDTCEPIRPFGLGETCNKDIQCQEGLICPPKAFSCRRSCDQYYQPDPKCIETDTYCIPQYDSTTSQFLDVGACLSSECSPTQSCPRTGGNTVCVMFRDGQVGHCFPSCHYQVSAAGYSDNYANGSCQPVGYCDNLSLVGLPSGPRTEGWPCEPVASPCNEGLVCINPEGEADPTCHRLCDPTTHDGCKDQQQCVPTALANYAYCG
jgi:hypothetical protein